MTENGGNIKRGSKAHRENYIFRKRKPTKPEEGENVLYVNRITSIKVDVDFFIPITTNKLYFRLNWRNVTS